MRLDCLNSLTFKSLEPIMYMYTHYPYNRNSEIESSVELDKRL